MRAFEFLIENETPVPKKVGREFNHLEDLVFTEPKGAVRAVEILKSLSKTTNGVSIKWDGSPTVYWGRDADGTFHLVGKNNWGREEGKSSTPEELEKFILGRGKGEDWRPKFASDMAAMWPIFERATPKDFIGYVYGDILFHPGKPAEGKDGFIIFTPNQTTYEVKGTSNDGRKLGKASVAVAAHKIYESFGDKHGSDIEDVSEFNTTANLVVYGQTYVQNSLTSTIDLSDIEKVAHANWHKIDSFLAPVTGMGYLRDSLYTFINSKSKDKALDDVNPTSFFNWLSSNAARAKKIDAHTKNHPGVLDIIFDLVSKIMAAKNQIISNLDQTKADITAHTAGEPGGEGYMHTKHGVKLVPRHRWTPFRAD